jgi:catechol 2,3-dioxygenase-like lactoylglutathione lyase family enzyme
LLVSGPAVHHVGLTVSDLDAALTFWRGFLGREESTRTVLERPYVQRLVGMSGIRIQAAFIELPDGRVIELLQYGTETAPVPEDTAAPGHAHLCLVTEDATAAWRRAVESGARPVHPGGPVVIDAGPNRGTLAAYLRVPPDWHTVELFQPSGQDAPSA